MPNPENTESQQVSSENGLFSKLINGDLGLAKTYWLYGVLVGLFVNLIAGAITSTSFLIILVIIYTAYEIPVLIGIWRAAGKYQGLKVWAVLAKIAVILGAIMLTISFLAVLILLSEV